MANEDFKKFVVKDAHLIYPRLDNTYRYDVTEGRSVKCEATANGASWSCGILLSTEEAKQFHKDFVEHYNERKAAGKKVPEFKKVFGMKKRDDGMVVMTVKKNGANQAGKENQPPQILAGDLSPLDNKTIWSGSTGTVRFFAFPSLNPQRDGGISLLLDAIQVTKAVYGSDLTGDDFSPVQMEVEQKETEAEKPADDDDPFGLPPTNASADFDDEIPF